MAKAKTTKRRTQTKRDKAAEEEVTVCRRRGERRDRGEEEEEVATEEAPAKKERRKVQRRRQIDPTTCERDYTTDEIEFMHALDDYKRASGRMFPTCSEILEVVRKLGYAKPGESNESTDPDPVVAEADSDESFESIPEIADV